jgi:hypothetical protein
VTDYSTIKEIVKGMYGYLDQQAYLTEDATPAVIGKIMPPEDSVGSLQVRYSAIAWDGSDIDGKVEIITVGYRKLGEALTIGTPSIETIDPGATVLTGVTLEMVDNGGAIDIRVTGIADRVNWSIITIFNSATAPEILL